MPVDPAAFRRRKLSLTSLIDVIFLLLLFFMLSSTFSNYGEIPFVAATSGDMAPAPRPAPLSEPPLFLRLDGEALTLNGVPVALADLSAQVSAQSGETATPQVIVAVAGDATSQGLVDVLARLAQVSGAQVTVVD